MSHCRLDWPSVPTMTHVVPWHLNGVPRRLYVHDLLESSAILMPVNMQQFIMTYNYQQQQRLFCYDSYIVIVILILMLSTTLYFELWFNVNFYFI